VGNAESEGHMRRPTGIQEPVGGGCPCRSTSATATMVSAGVMPGSVFADDPATLVGLEEGGRPSFFL
jgi:hypothetical protein